MYVKICGLRDAETAMLAAAADAQAVGVVMSPKSPRHASMAQAAEVVAAAKRTNPGIDTVLVTNTLPALEAAEIADELGFDVLQLHGSYTAAHFRAAQRRISRVWRATSLAHAPQLRAGEFGEERLLVDGARPGSGLPWDLEMLEAADLGDGWLLAGGLSPANVADAIAAARPWGVDVSSGVESAPGTKDPELIEQFVREAKAASIHG